MRLYRSKYADPGILPLVHAMQKAGFRTCCSCQGGEGHQFERPTVEVPVSYDTRTQVRVALGIWVQKNDVSVKFDWIERTSGTGKYTRHPRWRLTFLRLPMR